MASRAADLLTLTPQGLYCPGGDFHVDPVRPVDRALVTHGHSDHARAGHAHVMATRETLGIMAVRYGADFAQTTQEAVLGEVVRIGEVLVTFVPAGHVLGSAQIAIEQGACRLVVSGDYKRGRDPTCLPFQPIACDVFITEATFGLPVFRHPDTREEVAKLLESVRLFPERAHIVGAYALGKAQRVMALLRQAGYDEPIWMHGATERLTEFYKAEGIPLGDTRKVAAADRAGLKGAIVICPPSAMQDLWARKFPDPVTAFASGWMRVRARARQKGVELPLIISDHCDWDDLCRSILETGAEEVWVTHGQEDALVHWCHLQGLRAKPLHMLGYGDEEGDGPADEVPEPGGRMNRFAHLIDRVGYEPRRNAKIRLIADHFRHVPDPERGFALAALTGALTFRHAKPNLIRGLMMERSDPTLFRLSRDYVGDLSETVALMWRGPERTLPSPLRTGRSPAGGSSRSEAEDRGGGRVANSSGLGADGGTPTLVALRATRPSCRAEPGPQGGGQGVPPGPGHNNPPAEDGPTLSQVVDGLANVAKADLPALLATWLDGLDEIGRWALLKLITGELRIGVSARLAKTALASLSEGRDPPVTPDDVEHVWHGLEPPYESLFAWVEGRAERPLSVNPAPFRPPMLAHPLEAEDFAKLDPALFRAEWKWDGIRLQAVAGRDPEGRHVRRIYSRTGEDVSGAFPDLVEALDFEGALDGELLILRDGRVESFNVLQQRLNRKAVTPKMLVEYPAHLRVYDALALDGEDLRERPFDERRRRLEAFVAALGSPRIDLSPQIPFATWADLGEARTDPASAGAGPDADAIEGCMLKRADSPYLPGRPKGPWWKWKRDPFLVDAVMMYAQRGSGKRSSFYSDYTFGCWRDGEDGPELVPVGKAYSGFTDQELLKLDRFVRNHTTQRFGPVREVAYGMDRGLVLEVAFEGLQRSGRHKSGVAMRFPRIHRIRWDKPAAEADRLDSLERILAKGETEMHPTGGATP